MLRTIRLTLAIISLALITLLFVDFTGTLHTWLGWMARIQFLPAVLALNVGVVMLLVALTWVFGRVYCSIICPLGIFQDFLAWISRKAGGKCRKLPYSYSPAKSWLRYGMLAVFVIALVAGLGSLAALLAPYSSYGRIANNLLQPLWMWGNNALAYLAERADSYAFYETEVWLKSLPTFIIAVVTFVVLTVLAWRGGRTYCNTICPVGTVLGFIARYSWFRISIDKEKCTSCSLCSRRCKAACIDYKHHEVDLSRCVACMDCIEQCKHDAISYRLQLPWKKKEASCPASSTGSTQSNADNTRRSFLVGTALALGASALKAQEKKVDGGLAPIIDKKRPVRQTPILPPGAKNARHFAQHCTACQLCVSACPNQVLRPSTDMVKLMQPEMSYERGYCRPECVRCSEVCPTGAISLIDRAEKSSIKIGTAVWTRQNCITQTDGQPCDNCARHCPSGAIVMVADAQHPDSDIRIPAINAELCIGCGACETLCPARPYSAIHVEGIEAHHII